MNCAVCGKDNQPGTRFCVHCGASLAAAATPAARPLPPPSATAASATSARPAMAPASPMQGTATVTRAAVNPASPPPGLPAYEAAPKGGGARILLGIGLAALVIAGGFVGWKIFGGSADVKDSFARLDTNATPRGERPPAPPVAPAKDPVIERPQPAPAEPPKAEEKAPEKAEAAKADAPKGDAAKPGADADKARPASPAPKGEAKAGKGATAGANAAPGTPATPAVVPAPRPAPAAPAPTPAPAPPVEDRWAQMSEELQRCQRENLFNRIVCDQRVRLRFCDGYWGKVSQCPGNVVNPDRGQ